MVDRRPAPFTTRMASVERDGGLSEGPGLIGPSYEISSVPAINLRIGGKCIVVVSAVVAVALTALGYGAGWVPVTVPTCDPVEPFTCMEGWLATAGAALALANLMYAAVYVRVFGTRTA